MSYPFDCDDLRAAGDDARKRKREDAMFPPRDAAPQGSQQQDREPSEKANRAPAIERTPAVAAPVWRFVERIANTPENTLEGFLTEYLALRDEARRLLAERK